MPAEFGVIAAKGIGAPRSAARAHRRPILRCRAGAGDVRRPWRGASRSSTTQLAALDRELAELHKANPVSQHWRRCPGVGPISALTLALTVDAAQFKFGSALRRLARPDTEAELDRRASQRLGGISRQGNERLRQLLVLGATAVISIAKPGSRLASAWLLGLLQRRPRKLAAVALANKMARVVWAMMTSGRPTGRQPAAA